MLKFYQKRPCIIKAIQYDGTSDSEGEIKSFTGGSLIIDNITGQISLNTLNGIVPILKGDYVFQEDKDFNFNVLKSDIFENLYIEVDSVNG